MINKLIEIAQTIEANDLLENLYELSSMDTKSSPLILPLVGEYNAGKTTLINALTDSKQLEIAIVPTTSTIYQIYFHSDEVFAQIYKDDGSVENIDDISSLKNDELSGSETVVIFDTSKQVPENIVLVDTPGLSSADARHKQSLMGFLPKADGILLTVDINQQITRSLTEFIEDMNFAKRRVYLVITKCDTKPASEIKKIKENISKTTRLPLEQMICVSPKDDDLDELYSLLEDINKDKAKILKEINEQRIINFAKSLSSRIDELLNVSFASDSNIDSAIKEHETELKRLKRNIAKLIDDIYQDVDYIKNDLSQNYNNEVLKRVDMLIANTKSGNYDEEVRNTINSITELYLNEYKKEIQNILYKKVNERRYTEDNINLDSLTELDITSLNPEEIYYDLNLSMVGHEYDATISKVAKVAMTVASMIPVVLTLGSAAIGTAAAGTAAAKVTAKTAAKAATKKALKATIVKEGVKSLGKKGTWTAAKKVGQITAQKVFINTTINTLKDTVGTFSNDFARAYTANQKKVEMLERKFENNPILALPNNSENNSNLEFRPKKSITEMFVSKITDKFAEPKRQAAISDYLHCEVIPWFKTSLEKMEKELIEMISETLQNEADFAIEQKNNYLNELKREREADKEAFENKFNLFRQYKQDLEMIG